MTPLQEGLLGTTIIGIAIYSEPLAIADRLPRCRLHVAALRRGPTRGDLGHDVRARAGLRALHCLRDVKSIGDAFRGLLFTRVPCETSGPRQKRRTSAKSCQGAS